MIWGAAPSPFGTAVLVTTAYGLAGLRFATAKPRSTRRSRISSRAGQTPASAATMPDGPARHRIFERGR